ncbi:unnamed protein product [Prunus armeniaca]
MALDQKLTFSGRGNLLGRRKFAIVNHIVEPKEKKVGLDKPHNFGWVIPTTKRFQLQIGNNMYIRFVSILIPREKEGINKGRGEAEKEPKGPQRQGEAAVRLEEKKNSRWKTSKDAFNIQTSNYGLTAKMIIIIMRSSPMLRSVAPLRRFQDVLNIQFTSTL